LYHFPLFRFFSQAAGNVNNNNNKKQPNKRPSTVELWDIAFSDVMLYQQNAIAKLLTAIEEEKQKTEQFNMKFMRYDPLNTINRLRNQQVNLWTGRSCREF
jgi:hypothetical protein